MHILTFFRRARNFSIGGHGGRLKKIRKFQINRISWTSPWKAQFRSRVQTVVKIVFSAYKSLRIEYSSLDHQGKKLKNRNARLLISYNVCSNQFFEFLTARDLRSEKVTTFSAKAPPSYFMKRVCSRIFLVLRNSWKYYAKQPLLKVNWTDFLKLFVWRGNFQTWFISAPPAPPLHLLGVN